MVKLIKTMIIFLLTCTSLSSFACDVGQVDLGRDEVPEPLGATVADPAPQVVIPGTDQDQ